MNGRVYSPEIGRMISPDPATEEPENGRNYNRYTYVFNNPLKYADPSGYCSTKSEASCKRKDYSGSAYIEEVVVTGRYISHGTGYATGGAGVGSVGTPIGAIGDRAESITGEVVLQADPIEEDACADKGNSCTVKQDGNETILTLLSGPEHSDPRFRLAGMSAAFGGAGLALEGLGGTVGFTTSGELRWYPNGWQGNQHISPTDLAKIAGRLSALGLALGVGSDIANFSNGQISATSAAFNTGLSIAGWQIR
jgi:hypothetical protein